MFHPLQTLSRFGLRQQLSRDGRSETIVVVYLVLRRKVVANLRDRPFWSQSKPLQAHMNPVVTVPPREFAMSKFRFSALLNMQMPEYLY